MSLKYVILGLLLYKNRTGYQISKTMNRSTEFFWHASQSQIYPSLKKLKSEGLVDIEHVWEKSKVAKIVYSITDKGRDVLVKWLRKTPDIHQLKDEFFFQLFFSKDLICDEELLKKIRHEKEYHQHKLAKYLVYKEKYLERKTNKSDIGRYLTLMYGIKWEEMSIEFFQYTEQCIKESSIDMKCK